jgi:hypothetical protein
VGIELAEQIASQLQGQKLGAAFPVFRRFQKLLQVDRVGHFDKDAARFFEQRGQSPQFSRVLRRPEKNVLQGGPGGCRVIAEKHQLRNDTDGPLQGPLDVDQMADGVCLGFDEPAVKIAFFHQRQKHRCSFVDFIPDESAAVRILKRKMAQEESQLRDDVAHHAAHGLPDPDAAVQPQLGVWQSGLHVARIVTQPFEIAFGLGDVYDDRVVGKAFYGRLEFGIQADT